MGLAVLPSSLPSRGSAPAAASRACASRLRLDPACIGGSATAIAFTKKPKPPGSIRDEEPPMKRRRVGEDAGAAAAKAMSLEDKNKINRLLLSLLPLGRSPSEVIPLPDSIVRVLQENGTSSLGGGVDEIEIDVHALGDDALRVIKNRVSAYLAGRADIVEAPEQSKEGVTGQSAPRSTSSKSAPKSILLNASPSPKSIPLKDAWKGIPLKDASKRIRSKGSTKSIPSNSSSKSIPSNAARMSIPPRAVLASIHPRPALVSILSGPETKKTLLRPPAPPKPSESKGSVSEHQETGISQSLLKASPSLPSPSKPSGSKKSMKELLVDASEIMKKVIRQREIEKLRAAARQEVEQIVRTVEFNDPYIDYRDVFK